MYIRFGTLLSLIQETHELSIEEFAKRIGLHPSRLFAYQKGCRFPKKNIYNLKLIIEDLLENESFEPFDIDLGEYVKNIFQKELKYRELFSYNENAFRIFAAKVLKVYLQIGGQIGVRQFLKYDTNEISTNPQYLLKVIFEEVSYGTHKKSIAHYLFEKNRKNFYVLDNGKEKQIELQDEQEFFSYSNKSEVLANISTSIDVFMSLIDNYEILIKDDEMRLTAMNLKERRAIIHEEKI